MSICAMCATLKLDRLGDRVLTDNGVQCSEHPNTFTVSRRDFYRHMAARPEVIALAKWGDRIYAAKYENHDPGDEQPR